MKCSRVHLPTVVVQVENWMMGINTLTVQYEGGILRLLSASYVPLLLLQTHKGIELHHHPGWRCRKRAEGRFHAGIYEYETRIAALAPLDVDNTLDGSSKS